MTIKTENEKRLFSFYGTSRNNLAGIHPHERCSESEEFDFAVNVTYDDDGEVIESEDASAATDYETVRRRAKDLLDIWKDQDGIRVTEHDGSDFYVYRD